MWDLRHARDGWAIESGQYEASKAGKKRGVPDWYLRQPPLERGDEVYVRAFWELSSTRQFGYSTGPIPWHRVVQYGQRIGLDARMIAVFEVVVRELDEVYLEWLRENQRRTEETRSRNRPKKR